MSIQTIEMPTFAAQMGGNTGKALAEQLPKEVGKQRLAYALKDMQGKNWSPLQQYQYLSSVGGASPQEIAQIAPLLQQSQTNQAQINRAKELGGGQPETSPNQPMPTGQAPQNVQGNQPSKTQPTKGGPLSSGGRPVLDLQPEEALQQAGKLKEKYPALYTDFKDYVADVNASNKEKQNFQKSIEAEKGTIKTAYEADLAKRLQVQDLSKAYPILSGAYQTKGLQNIYKDLDSGMTEQEAFDKQAKDDLELAKATELQHKLGGAWSLTEKPATRKTALKNIRQIHKEHDTLGEFRENLVSDQGLTRGLASEFAFPLSENKEIESKLNKYGKGLGLPQQLKDPEKLAAFILDHIQPEDSITSMLYNLESKHYNTDGLQAQLKSQAKKDALNPRQTLELNETLPAFSSLGDLYAKAFW